MVACSKSPSSRLVQYRKVKSPATSVKQPSPMLWLMMIWKWTKQNLQQNITAHLLTIMREKQLTVIEEIEIEIVTVIPDETIAGETIETMTETETATEIEIVPDQTESDRERMMRNLENAKETEIMTMNTETIQMTPLNTTLNRQHHMLEEIIATATQDLEACITMPMVSNSGLVNFVEDIEEVGVSSEATVLDRVGTGIMILAMGRMPVVIHGLGLHQAPPKQSCSKMILCSMVSSKKVSGIHNGLLVMVFPVSLLMARSSSFHKRIDFALHISQSTPSAASSTSARLVNDFAILSKTMSASSIWKMWCYSIGFHFIQQNELLLFVWSHLQIHWSFRKLSSTSSLTLRNEGR